MFIVLFIILNSAQKLEPAATSGSVHFPIQRDALAENAGELRNRDQQAYNEYSDDSKRGSTPINIANPQVFTFRG